MTASTRSVRLEVTTEYRGTVMDVAHLGEGERYTIGDAPKARFQLTHPLLPTEAAFIIAQVNHGRLRINIPPGIGGAVHVSGEVHPLHPQSAVRSVELKHNDRARVVIGDVVFYFAGVSSVAPPPTRSLFALLERGSRRSLGAAFTLHVVFMLIVASMPVDAAHITSDSLRMDQRFVEILLTPREPTQPLFEPVKSGSERAESGDGAETDPLGGEPDKPQPIARRRGRPIDIAEARRRGRAEARAAASQITQMLDGQQIFSDGGPIGATAVSALNGLDATQHGWADGMGAMATGHIPGGGGNGPSLGAGGVNTRGGSDYGRTRRPGGGYDGPGRGTPGTHAPPRRTPKAIAQSPTVSDPLQRDEIRRVVRRNRAQYRYCYERALKGAPNLSGKVLMKFTIGPVGKVVAATVADSTIDSAAVTQCLRKKVMRWQFPAPRGGGVVIVRYPFLFKPS